MTTPTTSTASSYVNMASRIASSPGALEAAQHMQHTAKEIQNEVQSEDDWSLRVLTLIAGLAMMIASINGFLGKLVTFRLDAALCDAIVFTVGLAFVLLESGVTRLPVCATTDALINDKAPFLRNLAGRGTVFVATGIIELYMRGLLDIIVGCFSISQVGRSLARSHSCSKLIGFWRLNCEAQNLL